MFPYCISQIAYVSSCRTCACCFSGWPSDLWRCLFGVFEHGLNASGFKSVVIPFEKATIQIKARGVGGSALPKEVRPVPLLRNAIVCIEMLILKNAVMPLLAVTLLESCIINLQKNLITWQCSCKGAFGSDLYTLKSRHRSVNVCSFQGVKVP